MQILTITFLLTICPCDCPENRYGSCQVSSENGYSKPPTIATRQKAQSLKVAYFKHFRTNKKPPADKNTFINRWFQ
ncbi:MAG: hypothetical protein ACOX7B_02865, partial [Christensenellales bacterium]